MAKVIYDPDLYNKFHVFRDRRDAGVLLSEFVPDTDVVVAIPAGGVPVAAEVAERKRCGLKILIVSKVLYPWTTEAGFGAVSMHGEVVLDERAAKRLGEEVVKKQVERTMEKVRRRMSIIPKRLLLEEGNDSALLVDDGLASGYTMLVAARSARKMFDKVIVAVPTASTSAVEMLKEECDEIYVLNLRSIFPYAVADAYKEWHDVSEDEMLEILNSFQS